MTCCAFYDCGHEDGCAGRSQRPSILESDLNTCHEMLKTAQAELHGYQVAEHSQTGMEPWAKGPIVELNRALNQSKEANSRLKKTRAEEIAAAEARGRLVGLEEAAKIAYDKAEARKRQLSICWEESKVWIRLKQGEAMAVGDAIKRAIK